MLWSCPSSEKVMMGLMDSMVPARAVMRPMRPPRRRYSRVSTEKKGKVFATRWGARSRTRVSQEDPDRISSQS